MIVRLPQALAAVLLALVTACAGATDGDVDTPKSTETAIFAGGCFWCTEADFEKVDGVVSAVSGYIGGDQADPTYQAVAAGRTTHTEAVKITFDPQQIGYEEMVERFWKTIDPTVDDRQFCDTGSQYRTAIFAVDDTQLEQARASKQALVDSDVIPRVLTTVEPAGTFWVAEDYHQDYYKKNPLRYNYYRFACGRDKRLRELWG